MNEIAHSGLRSSAGRIRASPWAALGVGFGTAVAAPVLAVRLFITLLGIPVGIALLALLVARVPFLGGSLAALLGLAGVGACVLELHARRKGPPERPPQASPALVTAAEAG